jgi:ATP-dependent protease ClpP protease subunit
MTKAKLNIGGAIVLHGFVGDNFWGEGFTAKEVLEALAETEGDVTVRINSGGGYATDGAAIYSALRSRKGKVTIRVEGIAASAASLIAMAADELVMDESALLMIHDPRGMSYGTHRTHRKNADDLEKMSAVYAGVYSARTGNSLETIKQMMEDETWMTADEALDLGFANTKEEPEEYKEAAAFDYSVYAHAPQELRHRARLMGWEKSPLNPPVVPAINRAVAPETQEAVMTVKNPAAATVESAANTMTISPTTQSVPINGPDPSPAPVMAQNPPAIDPVAARRSAVVSRFGEQLTAKQADDIATMAVDPADALMKAANIVIEKQMKGAGPEIRESAKITSDEGERDVEAMLGALSNSVFGTQLEGAASKYRGLTIKKLAMHLAGNQGFGFNDADLVKRGMASRGALMVASHSSSDFSYLTAELMNRQLRAAYSSRPGTWERISRRRSASDFRTLHSVQFGVDTEMRKVTEDGEYQSTVLADTGESFNIARYGRKVLLTFEAVINDDLGAFSRIPGDFARGARNLESRIAWGLITSNPALSDGDDFFDAARGNVGTSSVIDPEAISEARTAMMQQRPFGADDAGSDFMEAMPDLLFIPPAIEITALQFVSTAFVPTTEAGINPYKAMLTPIVEPRLGAAVAGGSDTAWYLFDSSLPPMEHAYLAGYEAPMVETIDRMDPDGVTMIARHIFGAGLIEPRGAWKNAGA